MADLNHAAELDPNGETGDWAQLRERTRAKLDEAVVKLPGALHPPAPKKPAPAPSGASSGR